MNFSSHQMVLLNCAWVTTWCNTSSSAHSDIIFQISWEWEVSVVICLQSENFCRKPCSHRQQLSASQSRRLLWVSRGKDTEGLSLLLFHLLNALSSLTACLTSCCRCGTKIIYRLCKIVGRCRVDRATQEWMKLRKLQFHFLAKIEPIPHVIFTVSGKMKMKFLHGLGLNDKNGYMNDELSKCELLACEQHKGVITCKMQDCILWAWHLNDINANKCHSKTVETSLH